MQRQYSIVQALILFLRSLGDSSFNGIWRKPPYHGSDGRKTTLTMKKSIIPIF